MHVLRPRKVAELIAANACRLFPLDGKVEKDDGDVMPNNEYVSSSLSTVPRQVLHSKRSEGTEWPGSELQFVLAWRFAGLVLTPRPPLANTATKWAADSLEEKAKSAMQHGQAITCSHMQS
jgi:hypothetical protein